MDFTRTRGPIGDPLLDTVHRRHPDVDIVVLPPEAAAPSPLVPEPATPVGPDAARSARSATAAEAARLWASMLELDPELDPGIDPGVATGAVRPRLAPGWVPGVVVPTALASTAGAAEADRSRTLSLLAAALDGWDVQRRPGPVEQLRATRAGAAVRATYAPSTGVVVLEVTGPALAVGDDVAHVLVGEDA